MWSKKSVVVCCSHHRGPQHGVFSSSPFWFSVFTDSVSLAGTLAAAANKAHNYKIILASLWHHILQIQCLPGARSVKRNKSETAFLTLRYSDRKFFKKEVKRGTEGTHLTNEQRFKKKKDHTPKPMCVTKIWYWFKKISNIIIVFFIAKPRYSYKTLDLIERKELSTVAAHHCHH